MSRETAGQKIILQKDALLPLFRVIDLSHSFGGLKAVSHFHLIMEKGDILGLIGPNGAGKTTVFNLITGVYCPDEGALWLDGNNLRGLPSHAIMAKGISRTFQNIRLFRSMTVLENVMTAGYFCAGYSPLSALLRTPKFFNREKRIREQALSVLEKFGLADRSRALATSLSYGLQRKVELARALVSRPSLLLLDEPGAGLNPAELDALIELIFWIRDTFQTAIALIEHRMQLVMKLCERVVVLNFGETIFDGRSGDLSGTDAVVKAYFGEDYASLGN
jgi:branched-chain amino acid transport system ATP-binding protein